MKPSTIRLCNSLICGRLIALGTTLKRRNINLVSLMHILISSFADERKALDDKAKIANTDSKVDEIVDKSAGHTDFMSTSRSQFEIISSIDQMFSNNNGCN